MTPAGVITEFDSNYLLPTRITAGPDGNLWFIAGGDRIAKITATGVLTEYSRIKFEGSPWGVNPRGPRLSGTTPGPDGNLWFTEMDANLIGKITPSGTITVYQGSTTSSNPGPYRITAGTDGNLWFTERNVGRIARMTLDGGITEYSEGISPSLVFAGDITSGPDGNIWFTDDNGRIGRVVIHDSPPHSAQSSNVADTGGCAPGARALLGNAPTGATGEMLGPADVPPLPLQRPTGRRN